MPWQRYVGDVALEVDPGTGLLVYRRVVLTVPRQSGKTTLILGSTVHRAQAFGQRQRISYTAQTRLKARQKWEDEHVPILERSPFRPLFTVRRQIGQEAIRWRNGSIHGLEAPNEDSGHGDTLDQGVIDEGFAQEDARVEQGMAPAMITRPEPQLWVVSTAGRSKVRSPYLWGKVEAGRVAVEAGMTSGTAYFEWSAPPEADPGDPATWWACMPALGFTVTEETIRAEFQSMNATGDLAEFRRAYLNQWLDDVPDEWQVITEGAWRALADLASRIDGVTCFAPDITPERSFGSIAAAGARADGNLHVEVIEHRPRTGWMVDRLDELAARHRCCAVVVDPTGPAGSLIEPLKARGWVVVAPSAPPPPGGKALLRTTAQEMAQACGQLHEMVTDTATLRHLDQPELTVALAGAQRRPLGDGGWAWARKATSVDISPLVAVTLAAWGHGARAHLYEDDYDVLNSVY